MGEGEEPVAPPPFAFGSAALLWRAMLPAIFGLSATTLGDDERAFFREAMPAGFILFGRNIVDGKQLRALTDSLRDLTGRDDLPILVDQEGGRVARLGPPVWPEFPAAARFAALYDIAPISAIEATRANAEAMASVLAQAGINVNCAPVLDVAQPETHGVIGDRSFGGEPMRVAALGRAMLDGLAAGGVCGVVKHMPGHGRARADSHFDLPVVDADEEALAVDLAPFQALRHAPMAMVAHLVYRCWDPDRPASISPSVVREIIRGRVGFDGLLLTDDIAMEALDGSLAERTGAALSAGCDIVLHCSGRLEEAKEIAEVAGEASEAAACRLQRAMESIAGRRTAANPDRLIAKRDALLMYVAER